MKRTISFILGIVLALSSVLCVNISALAEPTATGTCGSGEFAAEWSLEGDTITFTGSSVRIPDYTTSNRPGWYNYRSQIKKVVISDGIIQIGAYAFAECTALEEVDFGNIDTLGHFAFYNCTSLKHAYLPDNCTWIYHCVFENCSGLQSARIPYVSPSDHLVPQYFFKNCTSLAVIELGSSITGFDYQAIEGDSALKVVITDNSAFPTGSYGIYRSHELSGYCSDNTYSSQKLRYNFDIQTNRLYFTGSGDMTRYENGSQPWQSFTGAVNKIDFSTTDAKTSVSGVAFQGRETVTEVDFTNIYAIGDGGFAECTSLKYADFDSMLSQIWYYAFANDTALDHVTFKDGTDPLTIYHHAFSNCSGSTYWLNLPSNTSVIEDHAFYGTGFNYITCSANSITIGEEAFGKGEANQYSRFFGKGSNSNLYNFVKNGRDLGYAWYYYCLNDEHSYTETVIEPTCTEQGYTSYKCPNCDADANNYNFVPALGHSYQYTGSSGTNLLYECTRCGETNLSASAIELRDLFSGAISNTAGSMKFKQSDYDGRLDLNVDGVINAKDFAMLSSIANTADLTNRKTTFNLSSTHQTIDGFGASAAWWSQDVGTWDNAEDILSLLYSKDDGIGLNIYRYNLGGGSEDGVGDEDHPDYALYVANARTHCFMKKDGTYDWNNDAGAMNALAIANRLNPDLKVTLFSNSAPYFMTKNGKTYGNIVNDLGTENLDSSNYQAFANFVATCAEHFIDEGYNVSAVSPVNEPEWEWSGWYNGDGTQSSNQEGCYFSPTSLRNFYNNAMIPTITSNSKLSGKVDVEVWECAQLNLDRNWGLKQKFSDYLANNFSSNKNYSSSNANIRSYVDTLSTHSYWASTADRQASANTVAGSDYGQKFRQTEYCQMNTDASTGVLGHIQAEGGNTNGMTIDYGLALADIIYQDMTILNATEWDWWTACGRGIYPDSLVYINDSNHDHIETPKRLWTLGNYSKFIEEGAKRIDVSTGSDFAANLVTNETYNWTTDWDSGVDKNNYMDVSAYLNPDQTVVAVYVNNSDTTEYTTFDGNVFSTFTSYVTDETRDLKQNQSGSATNTVCIPKKSVTTVVLKQHITPAKSTEGAYLFTYFTGNSQEQQRIRFAVSKDGYNFSPLNSNNEVITQTLGRQCCRDPYIFKGQDGYYYIIATDMDASTNQWWGNSDTMVIWRSRDLVNWSDETIISMTNITGADDIQRCWAPQVLWDAKEQKYFVYFGLASWSVTQNLTEMYYCYTDDLMDESHYSYPQLLYKPSDNGAAIDGDIFYDAKTKTYYLYYKDETNATICYVTSNNLAGPYGDASNPTKVINSDVGLEGCNAHFITGTNTLVMLADAYGDGYFVVNQSTDFKHFYTLDSSNYTINNCSPRHGSVIAISDSEYNALVSRYGI